MARFAVLPKTSIKPISSNIGYIPYRKNFYIGETCYIPTLPYQGRKILYKSNLPYTEENLPTRYKHTFEARNVLYKAYIPHIEGTLKITINQKFPYREKIYIGETCYIQTFVYTEKTLSTLNKDTYAGINIPYKENSYIEKKHTNQRRNVPYIGRTCNIQKISYTERKLSISEGYTFEAIEFFYIGERSYNILKITYERKGLKIHYTKPNYLYVIIEDIDNIYTISIPIFIFLSLTFFQTIYLIYSLYGYYRFWCICRI